MAGDFVDNEQIFDLTVDVPFFISDGLASAPTSTGVPNHFGRLPPPAVDFSLWIPRPTSRQVDPDLEALASLERELADVDSSQRQLLQQLAHATARLNFLAEFGEEPTKFLQSTLASNQVQYNVPLLDREALRQNRVYERSASTYQSSWVWKAIDRYLEEKKRPASESLRSLVTSLENECPQPSLDESLLSHLAGEARPAATPQYAGVPPGMVPLPMSQQYLPPPAGSSPAPNPAAMSPHMPWPYAFPRAPPPYLQMAIRPS